MALQDWSPQEIEELKAQGIDPNYATPSQPVQQPISKLSTIGATTKAHAGGIIGGGGGALGGGALGAQLGAPLGPVGIVGGGVIGGVIGALGGGYAGQKAQQAIEPTDVYAGQQQAAQEAAQQNPKTALATDIIESAIASGGKPSLNALRSGRALIGALRGAAISDADKQAIAPTLLNSAINPAINSGISYATTGQLPSATDLASQAVGGAVFSDKDGAKWAQKLTGRHGVVAQDEPAPEVNNGELTTENANAKAKEQTVDSPYIRKDANNEYVLGDKSIKNLYLKQFATTIPKDADELTKEFIRSQNEKLRSLDIDSMRQQLHDAYVTKETTPTVTKTDEEKTILGDESEAPEPIENPIIVQPSDDTKLSPNPVDSEKIIKELHNENPITPKQQSDRNALTPEEEEEIKSTKINSPLSDYNRYQELNRKMGNQHLMTENPQDVWKEIEEIKSRYGGNPPPKFPENHVLNPIALQQHILSGKATTGSILHSLANTPNHPMQELANELLHNSDTKSLNVRWNHNPALDSSTLNRSHYNPITDQVNIGTGSAGDSRVVLEEAIHSMTSKKIPYFAGQGAEHYNRLNSYLKTGSNETIKDLIRSYFETAKSLGIHDQLFGGAKSTKQLFGDQWPHTYLDITKQPNKAYPQYSHDTKQEMLDFHRWLKLKGIPIESSFDGGTLGNRSTRLTQESLSKLKELGLADDSGRIRYNENIDIAKHGVAGNPDAATKSLQGFGHTTKYAMGNLDEFIAQALKDPQFQRVLENIKTTDGRTVMQKIVDAIQRLLGISDKGATMLSRVLRSSGELVKQERQSGLLPHELLRDPRYALPTKASDEVSQEVKVPFGKAGKFFQAAIERAREVAPKVADAYHKFLNERTELDGQVYGRVKNVMERTGFTKTDGTRLMDAMRLEELTHKQVPMTYFRNQTQKQVWNEYKKVYREQGEQAIKDKQPVIDAITGLPRMRRLDDTSHPLMMNPKIGEVIRANTDQPAIEKLKADFLADQKQRGIDPFIAKKHLEDILAATRGTASSAGSTGNLNHFNANRKAQGIPLPKSWTRQDFEQNLQAFSVRNAADRAHYRNIERNPEVMAQLGEQTDAWGQKIAKTSDPIVAGNSAVRSLIQSSHGEVGSQMFHNEKALSSLATATFIASPALSGVHIPIANLVAGIGLSPNPFVAVRAITKAIGGIAKGIVTARENGILKINARSASDMWDKSLSSAERMQGLSATVRRISTLNDLITKGTVGYTQAFMETIVQSKLNRANLEGDRTAQSWLKKLDPEYTMGKEYNEIELNKLASRAVGYIHGTSDARSMPSWMLGDSEISGFFSLAHWSIGQTNRFMSDIYTPALRGDVAPLLTTLFGSVIGGYLIKELREDISGKKSPIPSLSEIENSDRGLKGNAGPLAYNMIAAMQYSGFGGVFSQIAKYPFDAIYKNIPQGSTFPLDEVASDLGSTLHEVSSSIANDPNINWVDLTSAVTRHILNTDFRLGREAYNQAINNGLITGTLAEKKQLSDKLGQLRRFEQVEGLPYQDQAASASNPYMNIEQKKFKLEQDLPTAMKELPSLVQNIMNTYHSQPDVMMNKLKALKENQYSTFPSLENMPLSFFKYLGFLQREEGSEVAQQELQSYLKHKIINETKASVVP